MLQLQHNDVGIQLIATITNQETKQIVSLVNATGITFTFKRPDGTVYNVTGSLYTDGTDGKIQYVTQTTDLTMTGIWKFQCSCTISGSQKISSWTSFQVIPNLSD